MTKKRDKYVELAGEFQAPERLEEDADEEGVDLEEVEKAHFEEVDEPAI
jgi:hypothetical protein